MERARSLEHLKVEESEDFVGLVDAFISQECLCLAYEEGPLAFLVREPFLEDVDGKQSCIHLIPRHFSDLRCTLDRLPDTRIFGHSTSKEGSEACNCIAFPVAIRVLLIDDNIKSKVGIGGRRLRSSRHRPAITKTGLQSIWEKRNPRRASMCLNLAHYSLRRNLNFSQWISWQRALTDRARK